MLWSWNDFALHLPQSMREAVREFNSARNFPFSVISVLFLSLPPKLGAVLNSPPGNYRDVCCLFINSCYLEFVLFFGLPPPFFFFNALGDRFYCHPFFKWCSHLEWRVDYVPVGQYHSQEKICCEPPLQHKTMHLFRKGEDKEESWDEDRGTFWA